ncbi:hypothetical protein GCM10025760_30920 [Microbacterium yannicii]|uniref:SHS2 domain-containing protein n=1 Tax=Microbacterium yannicii TaxID=671622 RepID=A0ABP9MIF9_9MICO|nr:pilus assembly protein PilM [Microbacterium yannicii]MCO5951571.1 pilus assembly protein PilM [Microbacterium yannicii]
MAGTLVGLEITEQSVRAVEVTSGRAPRLVAAGEVPLPIGAAKDSEVLDPDAVSVALRQLWLRAGIKGRQVVLGIGSRRVLVREYTTHALRPDLLKQALPFQVQDLLPVPAHQAVLDFYPVSQEGDQVSGLLVAAVSETVEGLIATMTKARLRVDSVDLVPFGLARVARILGAPGKTVAMLHVGDHTTYVVIAVDGIPRFVRIIPIDVLTSAARARAQRIVATDANGQIFETVPTPTPTPRGRAATRMANGQDPSIADLVSRLRSTIAFYGNRAGSTAATEVFLSGAGAAAPGVKDALADALDAQVRTIRVDEVLKTDASTAAADEFGMDLIATIGVTLREGY